MSSCRATNANPIRVTLQLARRLEDTIDWLHGSQLYGATRERVLAVLLAELLRDIGLRRALGRAK